MDRSRSHRLGAAIAIALTASLAITVGLAAAAPTAQAASSTITVAYSKTYVFDADPLSVIWWDNVKKQFEETYQGAHLDLQGYDGTDVDLVNKVALLYKSASTTPDVFMLPTGYVGQWVASNYFAPLELVPDGEERALVVGLPGRDQEREPDQRPRLRHQHR